MKFIFFIITFISCSTTPLPETWAIFEGRLPGIPIYRAKIPTDWSPHLPDSSTYLTDTTLPIFSYTIPFENEEILLTIHNFPTLSLEERIPTQFQVQRWQNQLKAIDPVSINNSELAYSGFTGYLFEATGRMNDTTTSMLAIAMQMIPEHYRMLQNNPLKELEHRQMRADYTIKAIGSPEAMANKREEILSFAGSFELIHPVPVHL